MDESERDELLIRVDERTKTIFDRLGRGDDCMKNHESRISSLEFHGAGISQQNAVDIIEIKKQIGGIQAFVDSCTTIRSWIDTTYGKIVTGAIAICAVAGLVIAVVR